LASKGLHPTQAVALIAALMNIYIPCANHDGICILISQHPVQEKKSISMAFAFSSHHPVQEKEQHMKKEVYPKQIKLPLNKKWSNGQTIIPLQLH
jgi:hypothetical protein